MIYQQLLTKRLLTKRMFRLSRKEDAVEFFGRQDEIAALRRIRAVASENARMTVLTGRRRVGKTALVRQALDDGRQPYVHLPTFGGLTLCDM